MERNVCLLALFLLPFSFLLFPLSVRAWGECPFGRVDDPYPGLCARYLDTNSDQICDLSQPQQAFSLPRIVNLSLTGVGPAAMVLALSLVTLGVYLAHWYLTSQTFWGKKYWWLGKLPRRYFWNIILLLSFIPSAVTGLLLGLGVINRPLADWHLWLGTIFTVVGFLHCWERLTHFLSLPKPR